MHRKGEGEGEDNIVLQVEIDFAASAKSFYSAFYRNVSGFVPSHVQGEKNKLVICPISRYIVICHLSSIIVYHNISSISPIIMYHDIQS